jgi:transcription elongation factor Elf1
MARRKARSMITESNRTIICDHINKLYDRAFVCKDDESHSIALVLETALNCLDIASESYRGLTKKDIKDNYFLAKCGNCGWFGSSRLLNGGLAIGDTGDYSDVTCPVCGSEDIDN